MSVRTYQPVAEAPSLPPLALPFKEGWQADRFKAFPQARTIPHDEQSSSTLLSIPPLAPTFAEGWQSDRSILQPVSRSQSREDWQVPKITPPVPSAFPEGWQTQDLRFAASIKRFKEDAFLPFPQIQVSWGWQPESRLLPEMRWRPITTDALILFPPAFVTWGWQAEEFKTKRIILPPSRFDEQPRTISPLTIFSEGWQVAERQVWHPRAFTAPDWQFLQLSPLSPPFREGWQAERWVAWHSLVGPSNRFRRDEPPLAGWPVLVVTWPRVTTGSQDYAYRQSIGSQGYPSRQSTGDQNLA